MDPRFLLLLTCFFLSGFAALLYQTAWTRELSFVFGTSELAVAAVLAAYMGGLALGAAAAARFAARLRRPVLAYGLLELAIALSALSVPAGIRMINAVYVALLGGGSELPQGGAGLATAFQLGSAFAVLLPPTAFMGATLPLLARHAVRNETEIGRRVGVLYAVNTAGAIAGTLCAAFWLMPELGLRRTVWVGAALNGLVFVLAALLARGAATQGEAGAPAGPRSAAGPAAWILPAVALSGAVSFAYEVLWTRLLGHLLGASLDAFATMLASFLLGIALGSAFAARLATSRERGALGFGLAQLGIAATSYGVFTLADGLPELSQWLGAGPGSPLASAAVAAAVLLPITFCIGSTFPFAVRVLARSQEEAARATARVYAWNTLGAIAGALGAGFVLLPRLGFAGTMGAGMGTSLALAAAVGIASRPRRGPLAIAAALSLVLLLALPVPAPRILLSASPLTGETRSGELVYAAVGRSSTVSLFDEGSFFELTSNGLPEARIERAGMLPLGSTVRWLGLLPSLLRSEARELLVVGLGGGSVLEPVPSAVERIDVIELEPEMLSANQRVATQRALDPLADPRVRLHIGDARGLLQLTGKLYDAVVSQPSHPWTAGASHLYTREFFALVASRLKPDGVFVQWIGVSYVDAPLLRSMAATLLDTFDHVEVYQPGAAMGVVFAASRAPLATLAVSRRVLRAAPADFARFGLHRAEDVAAARVLDAAGTRALAGDSPLITDDHNLLASRSLRLGEASLDRETVRELWRSHDPLIESAHGLDHSAVVRRLVETGFSKRAVAVALDGDGALAQAGLGWVELGLARPQRAARHFVRALQLEPGLDDAAAGLVASGHVGFAQGRSIAGTSRRDLPPRIAAVLEGRQHAQAGRWDAVAALDAQLAGITPGEALFEDASVLRARWRLAAQNPAAGAQALAITELLLSRQWSPGGALLRAQAAIAADRPAAAWGSLIRVSQMAARHPQSARIIEAALEIVETLPEETARDLRMRFEAGRSGRGIVDP